MSADDSITTSTGTTVRIATDDDTGHRIILLDHPDAPEDMRLTEAGRVIAGRGFQPAPFAIGWGVSTETLRAIADLIDREQS